MLNSKTRTVSVHRFFTLEMSCLLGSTDSRRPAFRILNWSGAGAGEAENTETIPAGKESIMSPSSRTRHRDSSAPRKAAWTTSWKATARGTASVAVRARGEGPRLEARLWCRMGGGAGGGPARGESDREAGAGSSGPALGRYSCQFKCERLEGN